MNLGLQLYSIRDAFADDPLGTLKRISELGYKNVEFANHRADEDPGIGLDLPAATVKKYLEEAGVHAMGAHTNPLTEENVDEVVAYHEELGTESIGIGADWWKDRDDLLRRCEFYNLAGEKCRASGMKLYYHTHWHEFQRANGDQIIDLIIANTDPDLVDLEVDAYWTIRAMVDPVAFLHEHGDRIDTVHQKDYPLAAVRALDVWAKVDRDGTFADLDLFHEVVRPDQFTEVGDGILKIQEVIDAAVAEDVSYYLIEQDYGARPDEWERVERVVENLKPMHGLSWGVPRRVLARQGSA